MAWLGLEPTSDEDCMMAAFPERPLYDLLAWRKANPNADIKWLTAFAGWYRLVAGQGYPDARAYFKTHPELSQLPIPAWPKLAEFHLSLLMKPATEHADCRAHGVCPAYYALSYPHYMAPLPGTGETEFRQPRHERTPRQAERPRPKLAGRAPASAG